MENLLECFFNINLSAYRLKLDNKDKLEYSTLLKKIEFLLKMLGQTKYQLAFLNEEPDGS